MKHNLKATIIILSMFLVAQFIGLYVVDSYATQRVAHGEIVSVDNSKILPYGMQIPDIETEKDYGNTFSSILISFVIAILILFLLTRIKAKFIMKTWFLVVTVLALGISFTAILPSWSTIPPII